MRSRPSCVHVGRSIGCEVVFAVGAGQFYLISIRDKDGEPFDGGKTYRLSVPPNVPIDQYWSVTAYDRQTHALIRSMPRPSRSSRVPELQRNSDGSIDVYFGPDAPAGKETNWVPTDLNRGFELMFRLYGPRKEFFDKIWKLADVEQVATSDQPPSGNAPIALPDTSAVTVTLDNFIRAESARAFGGEVALGGFGKFRHHREPIALSQQVGPRVNRDTLYSAGVFDLDAGPATITMPDAQKRFMSLMVIDEDHYVRGVQYGAGSYTLTKDDIGTRYVLAAVRTLVDPQDSSDLEAAHALQDAVKVEQVGGPGTFEVPNWDEPSRKRVRDPLIALNATLPDLRRAFGSKEEVDPIRHVIATASAWGGNPDKDASTSTSLRPTTMAGQSTGSTSRMCRLTPSGR